MKIKKQNVRYILTVGAVLLMAAAVIFTGCNDDGDDKTGGQNDYSITITGAGANGVVIVTVDGQVVTRAKPGVTVKLQAVPASTEWEFEKFVYSGEDITVNPFEFPMQAGNITIAVSFKAADGGLPGTKYIVSIVDGGTGASGAGEYTAGQNVVIQVGTNEGFLFDGWTSAGFSLGQHANQESFNFSMPSNNVTLTAKWRTAGQITVAFSPWGISYVVSDSEYSTKVLANPGGILRVYLSDNRGAQFLLVGGNMGVGNRTQEGERWYFDFPIIELIDKGPCPPYYQGYSMYFETWGHEPVSLLQIVIFPGTATVTIRDIEGIALPVTGQPAPLNITSTKQFTGNISWDPPIVGGVFAGATIYEATITLYPANQFKFDGVQADFFRVPNAVTSNPVNSGIVKAVFPITGGTAGNEVVVTTTNLRRVPLPVFGAAPVTAATANEIQYNYSAIAWSYTDDSPIGAGFGAGKDIKAVFTLTANTGFTFKNFDADLTLIGASVSYTPSSDTSIVVTAIFPEFEDLSDELKPIMEFLEHWGSASIQIRNNLAFEVGARYEFELQARGAGLFRMENISNIEFVSGNLWSDGEPNEMFRYHTGWGQDNGWRGAWHIIRVRFTANAASIRMVYENWDWAHVNYIGIRKVTDGIPSGVNIFPAMGTNKSNSAFMNYHHDDKWDFKDVLSPKVPSWVNNR